MKMVVNALKAIITMDYNVLSVLKIVQNVITLRAVWNVYRKKVSMYFKENYLLVGANIKQKIKMDSVSYLLAHLVKFFLKKMISKINGYVLMMKMEILIPQNLFI